MLQRLLHLLHLLLHLGQQLLLLLGPHYLLQRRWWLYLGHHLPSVEVILAMVAVVAVVEHGQRWVPGDAGCVRRGGISGEQSCKP